MKKYFKYIIPLTVIALFALLFFRQGSPWRDLQTVLKQARWEWLIVALVWQAASYGAVTRLNQIILRHYGADVPWGKQYIIQLAMAFIEAAIPSATVSGAVLRIRLLKPHGVSADVATVSTILEMGLVSLSVALLALPAIALALVNGAQSRMGLVQVLLASGALIFLIGAAFSVWPKPPLIQLRRQMLQWIVHIWDQHIFGRWQRQLGGWSGQRIIERTQYLGAESIILLRAQPYAVIGSLLARSGFEALGLAMCFYALGQRLPWPTMLLVYTLTIVVNSLGAIPGGVGLAEVSLAVLYTRFGVSPQTAMIIALAYRLTDYWLPRLSGGLAWLWLEQKYPKRISEGVV